MFTLNQFARTGYGRARWAVLLVLISVGMSAQAQTQSPSQDPAGGASGPIRLRQPTSMSSRDIDCGNPNSGAYGNGSFNANRNIAPDANSSLYGSNSRLDRADGYDSDISQDGLDNAQFRDRGVTRNADGTPAGDEKFLVRDSVDTFEAYLRKMNVYGVRRFGQELVTPRSRQDCMDGSTVVPPDYVVSPGDDLTINIWGSVDADLRLVVDRSGRINIPRIGTIMVSGVTYSELPALITSRAEKVFKNFQLSVSLGQLRSVRIYVTGYVKRPGAYSVNSLSTLVAALMRAGGPSMSGSFRDIQLKRGRTTVVNFDLYDLLIKGDRAADKMIQADDVIHVGPVGPQVALVGAVNKQAIFELKPKESIRTLLDMAGGMAAVADRDRLAVEHLADRADNRVTQLQLPAALGQNPVNGDVYRVFSAVDSVLPVARQNKRVRIEGEVLRPGEYVLPPATSVEDALVVAGGMTPSAFVFGTEFSRESVRISQQQNYERAVRDLETEFARASTQRALSADEAAAQSARASASQRLIERMRAVKPTGRIVLQIPSVAERLPNLVLEDGDRIYIPARPTSIGIFGSVFNGGSFLYEQSKTIDSFLSLAGGPTKGADTASTFVLRANGSVVSNMQKTGFFGYGGGIKNLSAEPGDTIFVPEEADKSTWGQNLREWTQIFSQFGLGVAALKALGI